MLDQQQFLALYVFDETGVAGNCNILAFIFQLTFFVSLMAHMLEYLIARLSPII